MRARGCSVIPRMAMVLGLALSAASCSCSDAEPVLAAEGGVCVGTPAPCASFTEAEACRRQVGCYWVYLGTRCDENSPEGPRPCEQFTEPEGCVAQLGCWWR
jgi:hypothetical protein